MITMEMALEKKHIRKAFEELIDMEEAEKLILQCSERHNDCLPCGREDACRYKWNLFVGKHPYKAKRIDMDTFKRELKILETDGNPRRVILEPTLGALVICINMTAMMCGLWGVVV